VVVLGNNLNMNVGFLKAQEKELRKNNKMLFFYVLQSNKKYKEYLAVISSGMSAELK